MESDGTKRFLAALGHRSTGVAPWDLVLVDRGGSHNGTWVHPRVADEIVCKWCSPEFGAEVTGLVIRYMTGQVTTDESVRTASESCAMQLLQHARRYVYTQRELAFIKLFSDTPGIYVGQVADDTFEDLGSPRT